MTRNVPRDLCGLLVKHPSGCFEGTVFVCLSIAFLLRKNRWDPVDAMRRRRRGKGFCFEAGMDGHMIMNKSREYTYKLMRRSAGLNQLIH